MKKIEKTEYPEKMYCKLVSKAMEYLYGACSNIAYQDEDCVEYIRTDIAEHSLDEAIRGLIEAKQALHDSFGLIPQWRDTNEELPPTFEKVLVSLSTKKITTASFDGENWNGSGTFKQSITAWMPLPEPFNPDNK